VQRSWRNVDLVMVFVVLLLTSFSCVLIYAATTGKTNPLIPNHAWLKQLLFSGVGFIAMWIAAFVDYRFLQRIHWWIYGVVLVMLMAVFKFRPVQGAHSWIPLPGLSLQPSEFMKLAIIITLASMMATIDEQESASYRLRSTWKMWVVMVVPFLLTLKEPALGQALVMFAIFSTMYVVFLRRMWFVLGVSVFVMFCIAFIAVPIEFPTQAMNFVQKVILSHHLLHGYQADRILTWLDPNYQLSGAGYEIHQVQTAIGSGELTGEGWLQGVETSSGGVPNQWNDYIFSAAGEEFGFVGSSILVLLFLILIYRLVRTASRAQDSFGVYITMGVVAMFGFQVFENIAMDMYMSPSTGITLPFISYGGSSLVANFLCVGIVLSVALHQRLSPTYTAGSSYFSA
jgi:rod shape determining protein RodA